MKPPARKRNKPAHALRAEQEGAASKSSGERERKWQLGELRRLLVALRKLERTKGSNVDIDYNVLKDAVRTRSISEIRALVESLKTKVISVASLKLNKRQLKEKCVKKPIDLWTEMASVVAGTLEEPITAAFSQMLTVSSTEPCTLENSDPPQVLRLLIGPDKPMGRTIPFRPMPRPLPVQGQSPGPTTPKTPALSLTASKVNESSSQQKPPAAAGASPSAVSKQQVGTEKSRQVPGTLKQNVASLNSQATAGRSFIKTTQKPVEHITLLSATPKSTSSGPHTPLSPSTAGLTPAPKTTPSSVAPTTPQLPPTTCHARFGRTSKFATKDSPRMFGVKCVVNFEKIYYFLSAIVSPNEACCLTPMESAIVLDLLMSLPEELPHLDYNKLRKHMMKAYRCLSLPSDNKVSRKMFKELKAQMEASGKNDNATHGEQDTDGNAGCSGVAQHNAGQKQQPEGTASKNTSGKSGDKDVMGPCPPLNPFMVPISLLTRTSVRTQEV